METRGIFEPPASDGRGPCWGGPRARGAGRRGLTSCHGAAMAFHRRLLLDARVITGEPPLARLASRADTVLRIGRDRQLKQGRDQPACRACPRRPWRLPGQAPEPIGPGEVPSCEDRGAGAGERRPFRPASTRGCRRRRGRDRGEEPIAEPPGPVRDDRAGSDAMTSRRSAFQQGLAIPSQGPVLSRPAGRSSVGTSAPTRAVRNSACCWAERCSRSR